LLGYGSQQWRFFLPSCLCPCQLAQSQIYVTTDGQSAGLSWCQAPIWGPKTKILLLSNSYGLVDLGRPLSREDGSVVYYCCCLSPAQPFSIPSPVGFIATFYCLRFETPHTWRTKSLYLYPQGTGWPSCTLKHWLPFSSPPENLRVMVETYETAESARTAQKTPLPAVLILLSA
jgi:hypothetical protein